LPPAQPTRTPQANPPALPLAPGDCNDATVNRRLSRRKGSSCRRVSPWLRW
jgi:hypothetical protein